VLKQIKRLEKFNGIQAVLPFEITTN